MADHRATVAPAVPYLGDTTLSRLLAEAGVPIDVTAVHSLIEGVLAAPEGHDPRAWLELVPGERSAELDEQLMALVAQARLQRDDELSASPAPKERLAALRAELGRRGLAGFVVPRADEHQNEYVPRYAQRLTWLTGFTGSAGAAVVLPHKAALFVDGRYTLQAREEVDGTAFELRHLIDEPATQWVAANLRPGEELGYDPWLHGSDEVSALEAACKQAGGALVACDGNPLDAVWTKQPAPPLSPVTVQPLELAGRSSADKRRDIAAKLQERKAAAAVLTLPDSICWLLNVRGGDLPHTPFSLAFALLRDDASVDLFIDERKLGPGLREHLGAEVRVSSRDALRQAVLALAEQRAAVMIDAATTPAWIVEKLRGGGATVLAEGDPCVSPKACKNEAELAGARAAHLRDGVAMVRFFAWLAREGASGSLTELDAAAQLLALRKQGERFRDESFDAISASGPNGAIVHYRPTERSNRRLEKGSIYLIDSGAQYQDGTTDITRTLAIGAPTAEQRDRFTRVLRGHIALATARFPVGTSGVQLDTLARHALWQVGLDYDHGTGHGVGSYLSVHEGPARISKVPARVPLRPGMILSNEPGYYKAGAYGIRIENLVAVTKATELPSFAEREMLCFETLTLAPIDRALVEVGMLRDDELAWLDAYHERVRSALAPHLAADEVTWLRAATAPLGG